MTIKYVPGVIARNNNVTSGVRQIPVYDDGGFGNGLVPAAQQPYVVASELGDGWNHRTLLTCTGLPISVADDAGVAQYGGIQVYTFPQGIVKLKAAMYVGSLTMGDTGTFIDAFTGVMALGSITATTGATLVSTEATWQESTAMATAASKVSVTNAFGITPKNCYDGHTTAGPVFLNVAIADDATHTAGTGHWTGTIILEWSIVGDY